MKTQLEQDEISAIARAVTEMLKPVITDSGKHDANDEIFDVQSLADYLRVSQKWIYERTQFKEIPHMKVKGLLRFRKRDIDKWLASYNLPAVNTPERILKAIK